MKIIILQSMYDSLGGIYFVNNELIKMFHQENIEIYLVSLRRSGYNHKVDYPKYVHNIIVNKEEEWGTPRLNIVLKNIKNLKFITAIKLLFKRISYDRKLKEDYNKSKNIIKDINADFIINSHYELLDAIPEEFLSKTIMHFHTNFNLVKDNYSYTRIFNKYKDKIYKFVWLTKSTCDKAKEYGYLNSTYIYNSVRIANNKKVDVVNNKNLVFLGRISPEKRINLLLDIFNDISKEKKDWSLSIYAMGNLDSNQQSIIDNNPNIKYFGPTKDIENVFRKSSINVNTSDFEGFSMTILEANEFGIPTISFDFGESAKEQIINGKTGVLIEQGNIKKYKEEILRLMSDDILLKELSKNCKDYNKNFSFDVIKEEWMNLLKGIKK